MLSNRVVAVWVRIIGLFLGCSVVAIALGAAAGVPQRISYQGRLTDALGNPLPGDHAAMFVIYDDAVAGVVVWSEQTTITADSSGVFSTILGSVTPIACSFAEPRWLEVYVDGMGLAPRREIVSVASALDARNAASAAQAGNADSLGHAPAASYSPVGHVHDETYPLRFELTNPGTINLPSNPVDWSNLKNVPAGFADGTDAEGGGAGDGHSLDAADGDPLDAVYVDNAGRVGISTTAPEALLHAYGGSAGTVSAGPEADIVVEDDEDAVIGFLSPPTSVQGLYFGDPQDNLAGWVLYDHERDRMMLAANNMVRMSIASDGSVGIGTISPASDLYLLRDADRMATLEIQNINTGAASAEGILFADEDGAHAGIKATDNDEPTIPNHLAIYNNKPSGKISLHTNNLERLTVANNGSIGIGTTSPLENLHIREDVSQCAGIVIENRNTGATSAECIAFADESGEAASIAVFDDDHPNGRDMEIHSVGGDVRLTSTTEQNLVVAANGGIGIGTETPERPLHVYSGSAGDVTASALADVVIEDDDTAALSFLSPSASPQGIYFGDVADNVDGWVLYDHSDDRMRLGVNNGNKLAVSSDGRVGIGTIDPANCLHIAHHANEAAAIEIQNTNTGGSSSEGILFANENGSVAGIKATDDNEPGFPNQVAIYNNRPSGKVTLHTNDLERVTVANNGNVGVGAISPSHKLDVAGSINLNKDIASGVAMRVNGAEALWYDGTYFSWGFGGSSNYFADEVGVGTTTPTANLDVSGANGYDQVRMRTSFTPTGSADARGNVGDVAWDNNYVYVKTGAGWKRASLSSW